MAAGAGTYEIRLEAIRKFGGELLLSFLKTRAEGCPLNPDDLSDGFIGQTFLTELADLDSFRHQFLQTGEELVELRLVADDILDKRSRIDESVHERYFFTVIVADRHIQREDVSGSMEFTVIAHAVAEPPLITGTHAAIVILLTLPEIGAPGIEFLVFLWGNFEP